jgi:hypothetical protein
MDGAADGGVRGGGVELTEEDALPATEEELAVEVDGLRRCLRSVPMSGRPRLFPERKGHMSGRVVEVPIGRKQRELVTLAELDQQRVDGSDLDAGPPADVANLSGSRVVLAVGHEQWERREPLENHGSGFRPAEALENLLKDEAGREDRFAFLDRPAQSGDLACTSGGLPPEGERPDARIDEEIHDRERSAL